MLLPARAIEKRRRTSDDEEEEEEEEEEDEEERLFRALESVWKITWSVFLTRGGRDIAEMEKQRGARDARGSEFSNDFDDDDGCCCCSSSSCSSSCFSSSIFVRSLCTRNRTHLFSPKRTVSRVRDDAFLSFFVFLQTAGVRTARSARIRTSGTGEEEGAGYRSSIRNTW